MQSCRRELVDNFMEQSHGFFNGVVLDIGGKKDNKRGRFRPPQSAANSWIYLNLDPYSRPDIQAMAEHLPFGDSTIDTFILCEVLEHLAEPKAALYEAARVLRHGGYGVITMPFLFPVHADPYDYQRWTDTRLRQVVESCGLTVVELLPMGGLRSVVMDLVHISLLDHESVGPLRRKFGLGFLTVIKMLLGKLLYVPHHKITTGFSIVVRK